MKTIIKNLSPDQIEALIALCEETSSYKEACAKALEQLGIKLSVPTLCRLYTTHQIREDRETRADYAACAGVEPNELLRLAADQLELRLLELASRPNPSASELRALFQIITRLEALKLSRRRVVVAEKREGRMERAQTTSLAPQTPQVVTQEEMVHYVKHLLGKEITLGDELLEHSPHLPNSSAPSTV